jgi:hypothetical protein
MALPALVVGGDRFAMISPQIGASHAIVLASDMLCC